jgi:hypothetical protein
LSVNLEVVSSNPAGDIFSFFLLPAKLQNVRNSEFLCGGNDDDDDDDGGDDNDDDDNDDDDDDDDDDDNDDDDGNFFFGCKYISI